MLDDAGGGRRGGVCIMISLEFGGQLATAELCGMIVFECSYMSSILVVDASWVARRLSKSSKPRHVQL